MPEVADPGRIEGLEEISHHKDTECSVHITMHAQVRGTLYGIPGVSEGVLNFNKKKANFPLPMKPTQVLE